MKLWSLPLSPSAPLDVNDRAGAPHLLSCEVDLEIGEAEIQGSPLVA
jgi:hypothetical protein